MAPIRPRTVSKVYLINAGNDQSKAAIPHVSAFPALAPISIATTLKLHMPLVEVRAYDGQVTPRERIDREIELGRPDVVGISMLASSQEDACHYAAAAKKYGAVVVVGNDQAALRGRRIMEKKKSIDFISTADEGELQFVQLMRYLNGEVGIREVPEILYREGDEIRENSWRRIDPLGVDNDLRRVANATLDCIPVVDRGLLSPSESWQIYLRNYLAIYGRFHENEVTGVTTMNRARGCHRNYIHRECRYCYIKDLSLRFSSPEMFWAEVRAGREQVGANLFYEVFDNWVSAPLSWIRSIVESRPPDLKDAEFFIYAQALGLSRLRVDLFKSLGVCRLNIGLDSGDDTMLKRLKGPRDSIERNIKAAKLAKEAGIGLFPSFVLGAPGESMQSLRNTLEFARWLIDEGYVEAIEVQPLYPNLHSKAGRMLMDPEFARKESAEGGFAIQDQGLLEGMMAKWGNNENPDYSELIRDWVRIFCEVEYGALEEMNRRIMEYAESRGLSIGRAY